MIFNSLTYLLFLLSVVVLYWVFPYRARLLLIFSASLTFYAFWKIEFVPVMLLSVVIDYFAALKIAKTQGIEKKRWLYLSLFCNLGLLFYFKYLIFFAENAIGLVNLMGLQVDPIALKIILPLGISFYTFQTISYTVDVYRGFIKPEQDFILYGCYVTFFPQLIAGPVLRAVEVIGQFRCRPEFQWDNIAIGLKRILYGLFLKVVLADNIAPLVDTGFLIPADAMSALDVWTLAFLFGFQIYFDFSAYSHIALGSARLMGFHFPENFNFPYLASSPKDFWSRWHISLSSWIRDYLYLPLAGVKVHDRSTGGLATETTMKRDRALFVSWTIMGLWHGAHWTFVLWGFYHAVVIYIYRLLPEFSFNIKQVWMSLLGLMVTFPIMMLSWIPFRADSLEETFIMWGRVFDLSAYSSLGMRENVYLVAAVVTLGVFLTYLIQQKIFMRYKHNSVFKNTVEIILLSLMIPLVLIFLRPINQFIYFQF